MITIDCVDEKSEYWKDYNSYYTVNSTKEIILKTINQVHKYNAGEYILINDKMYEIIYVTHTIEKFMTNYTIKKV